MTAHQSTSSLLSIFKISLILMVGITSCSLRAPEMEVTKTPSSFPPQATAEIDPIETPIMTQTVSPCTDVEGTVVDSQIPSKILTESIRVKVYLPPCYDRDGSTQYPVLYMLHGQTSQDDQWVRIGLLAKMDELLAQKKVQPFLIVLPTEIRSNTDSYQSKYGDAILAEVIPYIDKQFHTCTVRECRAIGGLSRGGNWAVHLGFSTPELFTAIGAHSAPLFYGEISNILLTTTPEAIASLPVFYVDVGNKDEDHADVMLFLDTLQDMKVPHKFTNNVGYHDEAYWHAHVEDYLLWYNSQLKPPSQLP